MANVTRYYEDDNRRRSHEMAKEHGAVFTLEQVKDCLELVKRGQWPDGHYGDDEWLLWSLIREYWPE